MTRHEYESARAYRDHLRNALDVARLRLSPRDYDAMAQGINAEISRLEKCLADFQLGAFIVDFGDLNPAWNFVNVSQCGRVVLRCDSSVFFNSPMQLAPWSASASDTVEVEGPQSSARRPEQPAFSYRA